MSFYEAQTDARTAGRIPAVPARVAVLRALQLGDLLCAIPALRAIRDAWPQAEITMVGLPWARFLTSRFPRLLDGFLEFPGLDGLPEAPPDPQRQADFRKAAAERRFDLAIQLHGDGSITNRGLPWLNARFNAGFYRSGTRCPDPDRFVEYPDNGHEIRRLLRLTEFLGLPGSGEDLEFPLSEADRQEAAAVSAQANLQAGEYVCLHPGARDPERRWPAERFAALAQILSRRDFRIAVTGVEDERRLTDQVAQAAGPSGINLAGQTSLGGLAALISHARLLICNDTGVSHVAAALGVPSVVIFSASDPARWAPLDSVLHRSVGRLGTEPPGSVAVSRVLFEADRLLAEHGYAAESKAARGLRR